LGRKVLPTRAQKCRLRHTACSHKSVQRGACHEALQHDAHRSEADKGVEGEVTDTLGGKTPGTRTSATAFIGTTAAAAAVFCPHAAFEPLRLPASCCHPAIAARAPGYAGTTSWPLPAAVSAPWAKPIRTFSDAVQRGRR